MRGAILGYAAYLPAYRLGADAGVRRTRVVASFDEDSTTMAVAAASAITGVQAAEQLLFATTTPAYLDKNNASAVHAALGLAPSAFAADVAGSSRSSIAALRAALAAGGLVAAADVRIGLPGSGDEKTGGDGAAALLCAPPGSPAAATGIADVLAVVSATEEVLDRWRLPTSLVGQSWEERFGGDRYAALVRSTASAALAEAGLESADHVVLACANSAVRKQARSLVEGARTSALGFAGAVDPLLGLAEALDVAEPGQTILVISAADGCDAIVLRATDRLPAARQPVPVADQLAQGIEVPYVTYLAWRGLLERELPRRPEPDRPAGPPSARMVAWKFGFTGSRCRSCGFVHLPPLRVCRQCSTADQMDDVDLRAVEGRVATYTVDHLAYSPSPPVVDVVVDFDGGGRCALEVADADADALAVGARVELTFRRMFTAGGVHNYFWKARLLRETAS